MHAVSIHGVISQNLCIRRAKYSSADTKDLLLALPLDAILLQNKPMHHEHKLLLERAILVDGNLALCIPRGQSADRIKTTLLQGYLATPKDWDIAAGICIPSGFVRQLCFPFTTKPVSISVLPTLAFNIAHTNNNHEDNALVPWTLYTPGDLDQQIIKAPENLSYVEFLLHYASEHKVRIDYSIFIYTKPLLFGQATLHCHPSPRTFYFARIISCKELLDHNLLK